VPSTQKAEALPDPSSNSLPSR